MMEWWNGGMVESAREPELLCRFAEWSTLLTNNAYIEGAICLALSLRLVQSRYPLRIFVVGTDLQAEVEHAMREEGLLLVRVSSVLLCNQVWTDMNVKHAVFTRHERIKRPPLDSAFGSPPLIPLRFLQSSLNVTSKVRP
jgi:hypothetical protein